MGTLTIGNTAARDTGLIIADDAVINGGGAKVLQRPAHTGTSGTATVAVRGPIGEGRPVQGEIGATSHRQNAQIRCGFVAGNGVVVALNREFADDVRQGAGQGHIDLQIDGVRAGAGDTTAGGGVGIGRGDGVGQGTGRAVHADGGGVGRLGVPRRRADHGGDDQGQ
ncbi:MAG: hypothetical protein H6644_12640 [Caldilineaceae bacterium]|nr:hypothetical protein [Caldilineaceae bacterium]